MDRDENRLAELLSDAVSGVEPHNRLDAIRARTRGVTMSTSTTPSRRHWLFAAAGAAVATAAVVTAVAVLGGAPDTNTNPGPAASGSATPSGATESPAPTATPTSSAHAVPVYAIGDTPAGPRLYREFHQAVGAAPDPLMDGLGALTATPVDPDYRTEWAEGAFDSATFEKGVITVTLADASLRTRPPGMDEVTARLAVQQVVYTLQAAVGERAPVQFRTADNPIDQVYGVPTSEPIVNDPPLDVLALVNVTTPEQGSDASSGTLKISGVASSFEANVPWQILDADGAVAMEGFVTAKGWTDRLYPWSDTVDVSSLAPGDYTFVARTDDPSGGEGAGPTEDTKTFTLR